MLKKILVLTILIGSYSCEDIIAVEDISQEEITILAPTNDAVIVGSSVNFSWQAIEYVDTYQLQIATPDFEIPQQIVEDTLITAANFTTSLLPDDYQWRIKGINFAYETKFTNQNLTVEE